jgi:uncharacterized caspase-like protein
MGRKLALVIGNSEYDDASLARLITPSGDVDDLAALLKSPEVGGFDEVLTLVNEAATSVRKAVARLFKDKSPDDLLLLYFSGHGVLDDQGHLYLAVKDTERDLLSGTAIPANYITGEMDRSRSKRQVLVLDCCHSGAFARGGKGAVGASVGTASAFEGTGYGRVVLTATDATQYAWEGDQVIGRADNSVFTHFMIQGLHTGEADQDHDGRITLDELYDYVYAQVVARTPKQTPGKWSYKQQGDIVIAKNPHPPVVKATELPIELKQASESPFASVREGAVRELASLLRGSNAGLVLAAREALQHLSEDDSRKVSIAATEALKLTTPAPSIGTPSTPTESSIAPSVIEKPQPAVILAPIVTAAPVETPLVNQEQMVETSSEAGRAGAVELTSATNAETETQRNPVAAAPMPAVLQRTLIVSGGWIAGWVIGILLASIVDSNLVTFLGLLVGWSIAGLITGLLLRRVVPSLPNYHIVILIIVWALVPLAGIMTQGGGGSGSDDYINKPNLIVSIALIWLMNSWFVLQMPPAVMWWQALVVGAAGAVGWVIAGTFSWYSVALKIAGYGWSLPAAFHEAGYTTVNLLSNVILSSLLGGGALAIIYGLMHKEASPAPAPFVLATTLEANKPVVPMAARQTLESQQRTAFLAGVIVSIGWFAGWFAGVLLASQRLGGFAAHIILIPCWIAAGVTTGIVFKQVIRTGWWPILSLGIGSPLCLVLGFYLHGSGLMLAIVANWFIIGLTAMLGVHNRAWSFAVLTAATAGIAWIIFGTPWQLAALKFFGVSNHWTMPSFLRAEYLSAIDLLIVPAITAIAAGSLLTFLLYRRAGTTESA